GLRMQTRQSPISSIYRSTTMVRSSGSTPVASTWCSRYCSRFLAATSVRECFSVSKLAAAFRDGASALRRRPSSERGSPIPECCGKLAHGEALPHRGGRQEPAAVPRAPGGGDRGAAG